MISKLKALFSSLEAAPVSTSNRDEDLKLCSFALMAIVAQIDNHFSPEEKQKVLDIGCVELGIPRDQVESLLLEAHDQAKASTSLYEFTEVIHRMLDEPSKFQLIYNLWRVAFADGNLDRYEEHIIRRIADLVYLDHSRFIEAKHKAQEG